ncbi:LysR family transcriptional regulator [Salinarimonas rosea]|uniref:LysR family transcriptional regulator n=1 Tax=Salinarimonas rosea TaxID=552063 RepID=UPI0012EB196E|nr:LysR family transcriptional regulator [Salinarimonas rosea]
MAVIEVRHLRYFRAVAEDLHFGRAAERLRIAQPALSRQIQNLERELGVVLLARTQRSVALTPAGALFLERTQRILDELIKCVADARRVQAGEYGHLTVGFIHSSTYGLLPAILERFRHLYPEVELELHEMTVADQIGALPRRQIDVGLLRPPVGDPEIKVQTILEERFLLAVPSKHALAAERVISLQRLARESFILFSRQQSPLFHSRILSMCERVGFVPHVVQHATQIHTIVGLVGAGMGIALVPETASNLRISSVNFLEIAESPQPVEIALAWRMDKETPALRSFRQVATLVAQKMKMT